jgi:hypothetical protein
MLETDPSAQTAEPELESGSANGQELAAELEMAPPPSIEEGEADVGEDGAVATSVRAPTLEPSLAGDLDTADLAGLGVSIPPLPAAVRKRVVRGRYRSTGTPFQVELRVDVDGPRPTMRVSADYYTVSGGSVTYFGSMRVDAVAVTVGPSTITIAGLGAYTWAAGAPRVQVTIPRRPTSAPLAAATLQHQTLGGAPGAVYLCPFVARAFRALLFEEDRQDTVGAPFSSYNTGSLPSGGTARTLTIPAAFREAGLGFNTAGTMGVVNTSEAGANSSWSDAELHAAMERHFSLWRDLPQWALWLFHAELHDLGPGLLGIMFDQHGRQRQGAAVFYRSLAGTTADRRRLQLYTCVHELGHCFNLLHSWQKSFANPPAPNRPGSFSWMNYPWGFPSGQAAFWSGFAFQFDDLEVAHLRHAFRDHIIPGGNPFATGAALEMGEDWRDPEEDRSGLTLELSAPRSFAYGAPVSVDLELSAIGPGRRVSAQLRPRNGTVEIAIAKPSDRVVVYRPLLQHCLGEADTVVLSADHPPLQESAFIHYGKDGFHFDQPGLYRLRARYTAPDGSIVLSNVLALRVHSPVTQEDNEVADLIFGDEQGMLLYLVGSDFDGLQAGNDALREIVERYPDHAVAPYARIVLGTNAAREFKQVRADNEVEVRPPQIEEAVELLGPVLDVNALRKTAAKKRKEDPLAMMRAAATELRDLGPRRDVSDDVKTFIRSRRREIATEVATELS